MAFWQYSFHAIPQGSLINYFGCIPIRMQEDEFNDLNWFYNFEYSKFIQSINYLSSNKHWSKTTIFFGTYESDSITIGFDSKSLSYITMRIDLRCNYPLMLNHMLYSLLLNELAIIDDRLNVTLPNYDAMINKIQIEIHHKNNFFS